MTRTANTNYTGASVNFLYATEDGDTFDREDVAKLAVAVDTHDHSSGLGLSVRRIQTTAAPAAAGQVRVNDDTFQWWAASAASAYTAVALAGTQTITGAKTFSSQLTVSAGGVAVTGNSSITGTLSVSSTLTTATITASNVITSTNAITAAIGTAIPAGGGQTVGLKATSTANFGVYFGSGAPTLSAAQGSIYLRSDGSSTSTRAYINSDGGTNWVAVTTAS